MSEYIDEVAPTEAGNRHEAMAQIKKPRKLERSIIEFLLAHPNYIGLKNYSAEENQLIKDLSDALDPDRSFLPQPFKIRAAIDEANETIKLRPPKEVADRLIEFMEHAGVDPNYISWGHDEHVLPENFFAPGFPPNSPETDAEMNYSNWFQWAKEELKERRQDKEYELGE